VIENWIGDLIELHKLFGLATRQGVKEVIELEMKTLTAKIESIKMRNNNSEMNKENWSEVHKGKKIPVVVNSQHRWVTNNPYQPLMSLNDNGSEGSPTVIEQNYKKQVKTLEKESKTRKKIILIGDSNVKGMAKEIQHKLDNSYSVQGLSKPGTELKNILYTNANEYMKLTKNDTIIIWGGIRDVSRNESQKGLLHVWKFILMTSNTNVIVMGLPKRWDLEEHSCVNEEVVKFNRKLSKYLKQSQHANYLEVANDRKLYTRHGLHLNTNGKEHAASQIMDKIKAQATSNELTVIPLAWKEVPSTYEKYNDEVITYNVVTYEEPMTEMGERTQDSTKSRIREFSSTAASTALSTGLNSVRKSSRIKNATSTKRGDFLG
jgi:RNase H-fold protein (predicted Holliday junction resolvase)